MLARKAAILFGWYSDPVRFFRDIAKQEPVKGQKDLLEMLPSKEDRILICSASGVGKTRVLAVAALWYASVLPYVRRKATKVLILSGSLEQSKELYEYTREFINNSEEIASQIEERLKTETRFKNGSLLRALPCSERAYYGKHVDLLIIDEAALKDIPETLIDHALSIVAPVEGSKMIMSSTPYDANSRFVTLWEAADRAGWKRISWTTLDCPWITREHIREAKQTLSEEEYSIRWEGKIVPRTEELVRKEALKACISEVKPRKSLNPVTFGVDWGFCLEADAEVLTEEGWKRITEVSSSDRVATLNSRLEIEYQYPYNFSFSKGEHSVLSLKSGNLELYLRPNHLLPVLSEYKKRYLFKDLREFNHHYSLLRGGEWKGLDSNEWTEDKLRLLGWYLSEGSYGKPYRLVISQFKKENRTEIGNILKRLGLHFSVYNGGFYFHDRTLYKEFRPLGRSNTKFIPRDVLKLPPYKLKALLESLLKGDGEKWNYKSKNKIRSPVFRYYTKSKRLADDVQELAIKTGQSAWIQPYRDLYRVNFIGPRKCMIKDYAIVKREGEFGSIETPNETLLVRFNGKPCFVHNTAPTVLIIAQKEEEIWNILATHAWRKERIDRIYDDVIALYNQYKPEAVFADNSHVFENNKLTELGLPVYPVNFRQEKEMMVQNLVSLIEHQKLCIWEEEIDLIAQLRDYTREKRKNQDFVDACMLAVKEGVVTRHLPYYYKVVEYR